MATFWRYTISLLFFICFYASIYAQLFGVIASSEQKGGNLLLDAYPAPVAVFSMNKELSSYAGDCLRIIRYSDNLEQDFGFVNNYLDTTAIKAFVGASLFGVSDWYNQTGNGSLDAFQATVASQPSLMFGNPFLIQTRNDFSNDRLVVALPTSLDYRLIASSWFGTQDYIGRTQSAGNTTLPFGSLTALTGTDAYTYIYYAENELNSTQIADLKTALNLRISDYSATDILRLRWGTAGVKTLPALTGTNYQYVDKFGIINSAAYSRTVSAKDWVILRGTFSSSTIIVVDGFGLQGQIVSIPNNVNIFSCAGNQITGTIPAMSNSLVTFFCNSNQLTGTIPAPPNSLATFRSENNQLAGFNSATVGANLGNFQAQNNLLPLIEIEEILAAFVAANRTTGTRILNVGGTGNASIASSSAAKANVDILRARGWTVTVNGY